MAKKYSDFDKRMKRYEETTDIKLTRRTPAIIRIDGNSFHVFTRGMKKPFDDILIKTMQDTMLGLCKEIPGCVFGYTQSDEITLILVDYQTITSDAWFDYRVSKICSIAASKAARLFNKFYMDNIAEMCEDEADFKKYAKKLFSADFDCRVFNVPQDDVTNNILWRQRDAEKNSIQSLAQSMYSQKELHKVSTKELQNKMFTEKGVNWNELPTYKKRGSSCRRQNKQWVIDLDMPIISENRDYIEKLIRFE